MLKELVKTGKLYTYTIDSEGGSGIVLANDENEAKKKIIEAYNKHGYDDCVYSELEVWLVETEPFRDAPDVLELF